MLIYYFIHTFGIRFLICILAVFSTDNHFTSYFLTLLFLWYCLGNVILSLPNVKNFIIYVIQTLTIVPVGLVAVCMQADLGRLTITGINVLLIPLLIHGYIVFIVNIIDMLFRCCRKC